MIQSVRRVLPLILIVLTTVHLTAQNAEERDVRRKPVAQLGRLKHFIGRFDITMQQTGRTLRGSMETQLVVKGFYLERTISTKSDDGTVDSEIRSLITWDPALDRYRIWRFVPLTPQSKHDGIGWFEGDVFVEEYEYEDANGRSQLLRNRITAVDESRLRIVNEIQSEDGRVTPRGVIIATRRH